MMTTASRQTTAVIDVGETGWSTTGLDLDGNPAVIAYARLTGELGDTLNWVLLADQDLSEVRAPMKAALWQGVRVAGLSFVLLAVLAWALGASLARPIRLMAAGATRLAQGDAALQGVDRRAFAAMQQRRDELGEAGQAFARLVSYFEGLTEAARRVAGGDLTVRYQPQGESDLLGNAFVEMVAGLRGMVRQTAENAVALRAASEQLAAAAAQAGGASAQITAVIQQVSAGISNQAEAVHQTSQSLDQMVRAIGGMADGAQRQAQAVGSAATITEQISGVMRQVTENAEAVTRDAGQAAGSARRGAGAVQETIASMNSINARVNRSAEKVEEMGRRSDQIRAIVETIEDIASQTNLLALNAAIEAACAGEHGKGFAVVADEVRKLAERSAASTKDITVLVRGIQTSVSEAVRAMGESAAEVESGVQRADGSGKALNEILQAAELVDRQAAAAQQAARRMSAMAGELSAATDQVSSVVEQNIAASEEMSAEAEQAADALGEHRRSQRGKQRRHRAGRRVFAGDERADGGDVGGGARAGRNGPVAAAGCAALPSRRG